MLGSSYGMDPCWAEKNCCSEASVALQNKIMRPKKQMCSSKTNGVSRL